MRLRLAGSNVVLPQEGTGAYNQSDQDSDQHSNGRRICWLMTRKDQKVDRDG
jgi:hypothetical protein